MDLVIGLGNPGEKYVDTRHNVGHMVVDELSKNSKTPKIQWSNKIKIFKSTNFMNESGSFVKKMVTDSRLPTTDLYIVHDDLDIPLGKYKVQMGKGPKVHNGLTDIYEKLGTKNFWHVRVGIDNRAKDEVSRSKGEEYVLQDFTEEEKEILDKTIHKLLIDLNALISK